MKLEDAIQQRSFRNQHLKAMVNILYSHSWLEEKIQKFYKAKDLTMQQYNILRILRGAKKPVSTMQIRERMLYRMSDTSRLIDRMVVKELVAKKPSGIDKRLVDITITEKGLQVLAELDARNDEIDAIVASLTPEEAEMLNRLLDKMRND